jgi:two-component system response regulator AtoC
VIETMPRSVILVVDDDPGVRESFRLILEDHYDVLDVPDGPQALEAVRSAQVDLVLLDIRLPEMDGIEVLERMKAIDDGVEVILVTAVKTVRTAVAAMKLGAFDYLTKPFEEDELLQLVRRALEKRSLEREVAFLRAERARIQGSEEIVGQHPTMLKLHRVIAQVARTTATVLISGQSGTGKELIARAIHWQGPRRDKPFVAVNPAAITESLIESELFGHERGAFTGAHQRKLGKFELAQGGTLFLDEIGTLKAELQVKLLRVLQEREVERVGGTRSIRIDVRFVAATNVDLKEAVRGGAFRDDLYYRLNVVPIEVPSLSERIADVPLLVDHFVRRYSREFNKRVDGLSRDALAALKEYPWPGNIRELENVIERCVVLTEGPVVELNDLPLDVLLPDHRLEVRRAEHLPLKQAAEQFERQVVLRIMERVKGNQSEAARILGIHRNSLKRMLERWKSP